RHPKPEGYDPSRRCEKKQSQESQPKRDEIDGTERRRMLNEAKRDMRKRVRGSRKPEASNPSPPSEILRIAGEPHSARARSKKSSSSKHLKRQVCGWLCGNDESRAARPVLQSIRRRWRGKFKLPRFCRAPNKHPNEPRPRRGAVSKPPGTPRPNHQRRAHLPSHRAPSRTRLRLRPNPPLLSPLASSGKRAPQLRPHSPSQLSPPQPPISCPLPNTSHAAPTLASALAQTRERGDEGRKIAPPRPVSPSDSRAGKGEVGPVEIPAYKL
ncbi:hypothetical protein B0H14DRAFT_2835653, partial [Mycena olivaceomarginata]